jgi:lipoyl-dependent peroxiredoxin
MKTLFTAGALSKGECSGTIRTPGGLLNVTLGNPLVKGIENRGPNPELLFAGAYSVCYHGALGNAAKKLGTSVKDSMVRALVSSIEDEQIGYRLAVDLHAQLPGIDRDQAQRIMEEAHKTCPYSKALRGDTSVNLVVDQSAEPARGCGNPIAVTSAANYNEKQQITKQTIMTTLEIKGDGNITKGKLKQRWAKLTDENL